MSLRRRFRDTVLGSLATCSEAVEPSMALSRLALRYARLAGLDDEAAATVAAVLDDQ